MSRLKNIPKTALQQGLMQGVAIKPEAGTQVNLGNWDVGHYARWGFQHIQDLMPTARIRRGVELPVPLERSARYLGDIPCKGPQGEDSSISQMLHDTYTDAFLVMHKGKLISENYFNGMQADSLHLLMSCTKSYVGTLAGMFIEQGLLDPDAAITDYVPEFADTAFAGATLRQCLDMNCGVQYSEDYLDPNSEVRQFEIAVGMKPMPKDYHGAMTQTKAMLALKEKSFADGERFEYRSGVTVAVAMAIEQVSGRRIQELLSENIWQTLACEWDAAIIVDRENVAQTDGGLNASARDWLRFGQMMAQGGSFNGKQVIPESWVQDCRFADDISVKAFAKSNYGPLFEELMQLPHAAYRNQWWVLDSKLGVIAANGIHGQTLYIDPANDVVIAKFSTHPDAQDMGLFACQINAMKVLAESLATQ